MVAGAPDGRSPATTGSPSAVPVAESGRPVSAAPMTVGRAGAGRLRVAIVAANGRSSSSPGCRKTALSLAEDGHAVTVVAFAGDGPGRDAATLADRVQPSPGDPRPADRDRASTAAPARSHRDPAGRRPRSRRPRRCRRRRRGRRSAPGGGSGAVSRSWPPSDAPGPGRDAVAGAAPDAEVVHAKALIALPVARAAARRTTGRAGRYVYDVADLHTESARLVEAAAVAPGARSGGASAACVRGAAGVLAATPAMAAEVARRFGVPAADRPAQRPPAWRPGDARRPIRSDRLASGARADRGRRATGHRPLPGRVPGRPGDRGARRGHRRAGLVRATGAMVVFLGFGHLESWLRAEAARRPGRMAVLPAVPEGELLEWTAGADVAFVGRPAADGEPAADPAEQALPVLMAGVPIVVGTGTEHCRLARADGVGRCCDVDSPAAIAAAVAGLLAMIRARAGGPRAHCRAVALERYSWEAARPPGSSSCTGGIAERWRCRATGRAP